MATFTKGPWRFHDMLDGYPPTAYVRPEPSEVNDSAIARVCTSRRHRDEVVANAHLIAAAPDLYSALQQAVAFFGDGVWEHGDGTPFDLAPLKAALAKATGQP